MILYKFIPYMKAIPSTTARPCRTRKEALAWFHASGMAVSGWATENGFSPSVVYALLAGRTKGRRGEAHRAAVALGLKVGAASVPPPVSATEQESKGERHDVGNR